MPASKYPGVYIFIDASRVVRYVGRSDTDVEGRVSGHELKATYSRVQITPCVDAAHSFRAECELYHAYLDTIQNKIHPASPEGMDLECPMCGFRDEAIESLKQEMVPARSFTPEHFPGLFPKKP